MALDLLLFTCSKTDDRIADVERVCECQRVEIVTRSNLDVVLERRIGGAGRQHAADHLARCVRRVDGHRAKVHSDEAFAEANDPLCIKRFHCAQFLVDKRASQDAYSLTMRKTFSILHE